MKYLKLTALVVILHIGYANAQEKFSLYDVNADPYQQVADAKIKASNENKNILIQAGGNWCSWCRLFYKFSNENHKVDSILKANYVVIHVNYSKENKNEKFFKEYKNPGRFGYPSFLVLDNNGSLLHIQDSGYLEEGKGYSEEKVSRFLLLWNRYSIK